MIDLTPVAAVFLAALPTFPASAPATPVDEYDAPFAEAEAFWTPWLKGDGAKGLEARYSSKAAAKERVLVVVPKGTSASKLAKSAERVVKVFDGLFAKTERDAAALPPRTAVLFSLEGPKSLASVAAHVGAAVPRLAGWASAAGQGTGFALGEPLAAGWLETVETSEVWSPENELANRLTRLLTIERFGRQPQWVAQGLAWHVEIAVCKDVYCFPYRTGFVSKKEHKSWPKRLGELMAQRGDGAIEMKELSGWSRSSWNETSAALSWGAIELLVEHYPNELPKVLEAYRALRDTDGRNTAADGSWTVIPDYEIPAERELEVLGRELGVDFLVELGKFARKPNTYRRPR